MGFGGESASGGGDGCVLNGELVGVEPDGLRRLGDFDADLDDARELGVLRIQRKFGPVGFRRDLLHFGQAQFGGRRGGEKEGERSGQDESQHCEYFDIYGWRVRVKGCFPEAGRLANRSDSGFGAPSVGSLRGPATRSPAGTGALTPGQLQIASSAVPVYLMLMGNRSEVPYGTLDLMVLKTLDGMGQLHGYGIARRIEQVAEGSLSAEPGDDLSGTAAVGAEGLDHERVGREREQSQSPLLLHHARREEAAGGGGRELVAHRCDDGAHAGERVVTAMRVLLARLLGRGVRRRNWTGESRSTWSCWLPTSSAKGSSRSARIEARRRLGNLTALKENYREQRRLPFLEPLGQDLGYALRQLRRSPGFAAAAMLTLALGIGANVRSTRPWTRSSSASCRCAIRRAWCRCSCWRTGRPSTSAIRCFASSAQQQQVLDGVFAVSDFPLRQAVLRAGGALRGVKGSLVRAATSASLGVAARTGRMLQQDDDRAGAPPVAVLSDAFWAREFGRSPAALGQTLRINNAAATVIGVAPPEFFGETVGSAPDVWLPISLQPQVMPGDWLNAPSSSWLTVMDVRAHQQHATRSRQHARHQQAGPASIRLYRWWPVCIYSAAVTRTRGCQ